MLFSASNLANALSLDEQRNIFSDTLVLQSQKNWDKANQNIEAISDYPLAYLAQYNYLKANIGIVNDQEILDFISTHKSKSVSDELQRSYLFYVSKRKDWSQFLTAYPQMPNNRLLKCYYLQASIATGQGEKAWPDAQKYWLSSTSLPNACDDVYVYYQDQKLLSQEDIWQRFKLAYVSNKQGLMRFLMARMDQRSAAIASQLYSLHSNPQVVLNSDLFTSREAKRFDFLVPTIKRLASKDLDKAMLAYHEFNKTTPFTADESIQIKTEFARLIIQREKTTYFSWLDNELGALGNKSLIEQRIRYAIKRSDWKSIAFWLIELPEDARNTADWLYWQARVLENDGKQQAANDLYKRVAQNRNFHGFMAAQKLGVDFSLNAQSIVEEEDSLESLDGELAVIKELLFQDLNFKAKQQWLRLLGSQSITQQQQLGLYAFNHEWPYLAVLASITSTSWDALNIRFPKGKEDIFVNAAEKYNVEESYIYAITRRESSFDEYAKSPVGASGYMQLMPKTAKETARVIGLTDYKHESQLNQGGINVQLGAAYFNGLLDRFDGNRILATAAYNAGPYRVGQWSSKDKNEANGGLDVVSWIDTIPYYETRAYVQNVLAYNLIYQDVLGKPLSFLKEKELLGRY